MLDTRFDELLLDSARDSGAGISPERGIDAFEYILNHATLPSVVVSVHDFYQVIEHAKAANQPYILDHLEPISVSQQHERPAVAGDYVAPSSDLEYRIARIWQHVLGIKEVGIHDNFFELGGSSLSGIQLVAELKKELGIDIPAVSIFEAPTIHALVAYVHPGSNGQSALQRSVARAERKLQRKRT
jgi:acyl carrier protein